MRSFGSQSLFIVCAQTDSRLCLSNLSFTQVASTHTPLVYKLRVFTLFMPKLLAGLSTLFVPLCSLLSGVFTLFAHPLIIKTTNLNEYNYKGFIL